jgi:hypothetical protein
MEPEFRRFTTPALLTRRDAALSHAARGSGLFGAAAVEGDAFLHELALQPASLAISPQK